MREFISFRRAALLGLAAVLLLNGKTWAQEREHRDEGRERHEDEREHRDLVRERHIFREHDVHRFGVDELARWRGGYWRNSCFGGRCGWWWFTGGQWYFYERPVYPYPLVVSEVAFVEPAVVAPAVGPAVPVAPPPPAPVYAPPAYSQPAAPALAPPAPASATYYYCDNPPGYYPTVQTCASQFRQVPAPPPPR
jgi:hypothetical protein